MGALTVSNDLHSFKKIGINKPQGHFFDFERFTSCYTFINIKHKRYNKLEKEIANGHTPRYVWVKNVIFFPRMINNKIVFVIRVKPNIQIVLINQISDLTKEFWEQYLYRFDKHILIYSKYEHEISYIGGGCPPIETING